MLGAMDRKKPQPPQSSGKQPAPKGTDLTDAKEWEKLHKDMFDRGGTLDKMEAYADKYLVTDEELPLHRHLQLLTIVGAVLVFLLWASFATLEQVARGEGKVIPSSQIQIIQHQEGGTVDALLVKEGERVTTGQVLVRLRDVGAQSDLNSSTARYGGLMAKIARLQAEAENLPTPNFTE
ncbi:MAG TPA: HlyD family type I secretion periplasmic adaptor subunit, partial [Alphaproteobacteria bacterium]